jgi:hypothetical protein
MQVKAASFPSPASLAHPDDMERIIRETCRHFFRHQEHATGPIADGAAVIEVHGPRHRRVGHRDRSRIPFHGAIGEAVSLSFQPS